MTRSVSKTPKRFNLSTGQVLAGKYQVLSHLGTGWEGEVYRVRERRTGIERAAKVFYPNRNKRNVNARRYARKLHKLRNCPIMIQYVSQEEVQLKENPATAFISEFFEGEPLERYLQKQPGGRLSYFEALHLLYALVCGVEQIHRTREYHGDLHLENIMVIRRGIGFDVKLVDMYDWGRPSKMNTQDDICDMIRILYDSIGGGRFYAAQPKVFRDICCGLKRSLILKRFRTVSALKQHLETLVWQ